MNIVRSLYRRSTGERRSPVSGVQASLVEDFQCLGVDEHPIIDDEEGTTVPPLACAFCPVKGYTHILALADENGCVIIYNTHRTGIQAATAEWLSHTNAVFDLTWLKTEQKFLTASGDQTSVLWDAVSNEKLEVFKGHTSSVKSVCIGHDNDAVFATGSRDGHIMIWDKRCNKKDQRIPPVNIIRNAHSLPPLSASKSRKKTKLGPVLDSQQSVTNVLFQDQFHLVSAGAVDGVIKVWDLRKNYSTISADPIPKYSLPYGGLSLRKHGFSSLIFDSTNTLLYANCTDDVIYEYDLMNYSPNPVNCYKGHQNSTFYVKSSLSPDDLYLASGSSDQAAYIWKVGSPHDSPVTLKGHSAEVTSVAWSPDDFTKIATLSDDNTMRVWRSTKRLQLPKSLSVIGTAEKISKEIGVSTSSLGILGSPVARQSGGHTLTWTPPAQKVRSFGSTQNSSHSNTLSGKKVGNIPPQTPPSIKKWFSRPSNSDKPVQTETSNKENQQTGAAKGSSIVNSRTPVCKRKLIDSESETSHVVPSKRVCREPLENVVLKNNKIITQTEMTTSRQGSTRLLSDVMESPVKKVSNSHNTTVSSPTANLPNLVFGIGVVTPTKSAHSPAHKGKGHMNWLTKLRLQRQTDACPLLLSPKSSHISQDTERLRDTDSDSLSPARLKSPLPGNKSILSYFRGKEH